MFLYFKDQEDLKKLKRAPGRMKILDNSVKELQAYTDLQWITLSRRTRGSCLFMDLDKYLKMDSDTRQKIFNHCTEQYVQKNDQFYLEGAVMSRLDEATLRRGWNAVLNCLPIRGWNSGEAMIEEINQLSDKISQDATEGKLNKDQVSTIFVYFVGPSLVPTEIVNPKNKLELKEMIFRRFMTQNSNFVDRNEIMNEFVNKIYSKES